MPLIANEYSGNGLPNDTTLSTSNVNNSGNFRGTGILATAGGSAGWTFTAAGGPTVKTAGDGISVQAGTATMVGRLDGFFSVAQNAVRGQLKSKCPVVTTEQTGISEDLIVRAGTQTICYVRMDPSTRVVTVRDANNSANLGSAPALAAGDVYVVRVGLQQDATAPSVSNGRLWWRLDNLTNGSYNGSGYYYYSTGWAADGGANIGANLSTTAGITAVRAGKTDQNSTMPAPRMYEFIGAEGITVPTTDKSEAALTAWLADLPTIPNNPPTATITGNQNATPGADVLITVSPSDSDGTIASIAWSIVAARSSVSPTLVDNATGNAPTSTTTTVKVVGPAIRNLVTVRALITDNLGATVAVECEVRTNASGSATLVPLAINAVGSSGSWSRVGGSATDGAALADNSDATYLESGALTSTEQWTEFRWEPSGPRSSGQMSPLRLGTDVGTGNAIVRLVEGTTVRQTWTQAVTATPTDYTFTLDPATIAAIVDPGNLRARVGFTS